MAPALSVVLGAELAGSGVIVLANGHLALVGILTALSAFLLLSLLLMLCASCQGQKKASGHPGDHETLMNGVSEKDVCSQSVESHGTDLAASSSHNGPLTSGTVLTDTMDTSPHPSEEMLSSQSELRSSKCPQDRELPSIPAAPGGGPALNGSVTSDPQASSGDGTYEMVRDGGGGASRDVSAEDSLYETVKEMKGDAGLANGTLGPPHEEPLPHAPGAPGGPSPPPPLMMNGHLTPTSSPPTPDRGPLVAGVEYASVDLNKKSRFSADLEARRRSPPATTPDPGREEEEEEEEKPPPVPDKVLDENENQRTLSDVMLQNGQVHSPGSPGSEGRNHGPSDSELYSTVVKPLQAEEEEEEEEEEDKEGDYSCIGDLRGLASESESESGFVFNDLYATVKDLYPLVPGDPVPGDPADPSDGGYETIRIPRGGDSDGQSEAGVPVEPDYESVGELGLSRETSRL